MTEAGGSEEKRWISASYSGYLQRIGKVVMLTGFSSLAESKVVIWKTISEISNDNFHYNDVIMSPIASLITGVSIAYSSIC